MNEPRSAPPPPLIRRPAPPAAFWRRLLASRRVRLFFVVAVLLHAGIVALISSNRTLRDWLFNTEREAKPVNLTHREVDKAVATLIELYKGKFTESLRVLHDYRGRIDAAQSAKYSRMSLEDEDRRRRIEAKEWPSAEHPNPRAVYVARIDVAARDWNFQPMPPPGTLDLAEAFRRHSVLEGEAARLFEWSHALELSTSIDAPLPLSQALEASRLELPKRGAIRPDFLETRVGSQEELDAFRRELTDLYLETQDMVNQVARWVDMAESRGAAMALSTLFGEQTKLIPKPVPYYGHFLNPRLFRKVEMNRLINPMVSLGTSIGESEVAAGAQWVSPDRWYYVGPFTHPGQNRPNERRMADLHYRYPPESAIDLDAVYSGRNGRELRWKYRTFGRNELLGRVADDALRIFPYTVDNDAYAIWYFYTEIWSDADRTVVASFASDDFGLCWVNGEMVYQSPPDTQPWVPFSADGFRPVPLKKGFNTVLYKLENWTGTTGFSMLLMTYEDPQLLRAIEAEANRGP